MHQNKEQILMHYDNSVECVKKLLDLTEEQWRTPIAKGKWTIAEVVGHFPARDYFILNERLPYLFDKKKLPKAPDENDLNVQSSIESQTKTKEALISKFISVRRSLIIAINNIDDNLWEKRIKIDQNTLTITNYLEGFVEYDEHHFKQIQEVLSHFETTTNNK